MQMVLSKQVTVAHQIAILSVLHACWQAQHYQLAVLLAVLGRHASKACSLPVSTGAFEADPEAIQVPGRQQAQLR